jgi:hypothetical protein
MQISEDGTRKAVHYASRRLTPVEQRYSQIEREGLAIVWSCEHLNMYLYGSHFTILTDHKPLVSLFSNARSKPSARLQGWTLRLQPYLFDIIHRPGTSNPADYLSRHINGNTPKSTKEEALAERVINYICDSSIPKPIKPDELEKAT